MSSITAQEQTELTTLLRIPPHKRQSREVQRISKLLHWVPLFASYSPSVLEACCRCMRSAEYSNGDFVFRCGQQGETFCIILQGKVGVMLPATMASMVAPNKPSIQPLSKAKGLSYAKQGMAVSLLRRTSVSIPQENEEVEVTELGPGASFGELALLQNAPRAASIVCKERTILAVLKKEHFDSVLKEFEGRKLNEKLIILRDIPAFEGWSRVGLSKLIYYLIERQYRRSNILYREGDPANEAYIVLEGEFKLTKSCKLSPKSSELPSNLQLQVAIKGPKEVFGEAELLRDQSRTMTCECVSTTGQVWVISKGDFVKRMQNAETLNFLHRREERDKRWIAKRVETLVSLEGLKIGKSVEMRRTPLSLPPSEVTSLTSRLKRFSNTSPELTPLMKAGGASSRHATPAGHQRTASGDSAWSRASASKSGSKLQIYIRKMQSRRNLFSVQSATDLRRAK